MNLPVLKRLAIGLVAGIPLIIAACQAELPTADTGSVKPQPLDSLPVSVLGTPRLTVSPINRNLCDVSVAVRDAKGKLVQWQRQRHSVDVRAKSTDTLLTGVTIVRFASDGRQSDDVRCVLPKGDSTAKFVANYFRTPNQATTSTNTGFVVPSSFGTGTMCHTYDWVTWLCDGGVECTYGIMLRAPTRASALAAPTSAPVTGGTASTGNWGYPCSGGGSDGCTLLAMGNPPDDYELFYEGECEAELGGGDPGGGGTSTSCGQDSTWVGSALQMRRASSICVPDFPDEEIEPDPQGVCISFANIADSLASESVISCGAELVPYMIRAAVLKDCPAAATGSALIIQLPFPRFLSFDLTRKSAPRYKSFGSIYRTDVAYYTGTVWEGTGLHSKVTGDVWCTAGAGIFLPFL